MLKKLMLGRAWGIVLLTTGVVTLANNPSPSRMDVVVVLITTSPSLASVAFNKSVVLSVVFCVVVVVRVTVAFTGYVVFNWDSGISSKYNNSSFISKGLFTLSSCKHLNEWTFKAPKTLPTNNRHAIEQSIIFMSLLCTIFL